MYEKTLNKTLVGLLQFLFSMILYLFLLLCLVGANKLLFLSQMCYLDISVSYCLNKHYSWVSLVKTAEELVNSFH